MSAGPEKENPQSGETAGNLKTDVQITEINDTASPTEKQASFLDAPVSLFPNSWKIDQPVSFTLFKSDNDILTKRYTKSEDNIIVKTPSAQMTRGWADRITTDFSNIGKGLKDADEKTAWGYGLFDAVRGERVRIVTKAKEKGSAISRSLKHFKYPPGVPALCMFDHDFNLRGRSFTPEEFVSILADSYAPFADAAYWCRGSVSAGVHLAGEEPKPAKSFHVWFAVLDAADIQRFCTILFKLLWLAGFGFLDISGAGICLVRALFDGSVASPERLDFIAPPRVGDGFSGHRRKPSTAPAHTSTPIYYPISPKSRRRSISA